MNQVRQSEIDRRKVKSLSDRGRLEGASVKSAAADPGNSHSVNERSAPAVDNSIEKLVAPAAIERALSIYQQLKERDRSVVVQARKILTQHVYAMIDLGENDEHRLTVGGLTHLRSIERDHAIKSASDSQRA